MDKSPSKNVFQKILSLFNGKNRRNSPEEIEDYPLVSISRPDLKFRIQDSLKRQGLFFVDLGSGTLIDGLIDLPSIGLILSSPQPEAVVQSTKFGFLGVNCQSSVPEAKEDDDNFELDAVLYFDYDGPECTTGYLPDLSFLCFLKIWNDVQLYEWEDILNKVVEDLTVDSDYGIPVPLVKFFVTTTFVPDNPEKDNRLIIPKKKPEIDTDDAVSSLQLNVDDGCEDEDEDL